MLFAPEEVNELNIASLIITIIMIIITLVQLPRVLSDIKTDGFAND